MSCDRQRSRRSLKVSLENIQEVRLAFSRSPFPSQQALATELGLSRDTVRKFFSGIPIERLNFIEFCEKLGLEWQDIIPKTDDTSQSTLPSDFYVERPPIESDCCEAIVKPGALLRIKAPQQMGKTWLMRRVLKHTREQGYTNVTLSFNLADSRIFTDLERFSKWFCVAVSQKLGLPNQLTDYWDDILGCNYNTTVYFQNYLLAKVTSPLVLALDKVDLVFEHPEIALDFCRLLRNWHDQARRGDRTSSIWQKLRLIIVHSTEVYRSLDINSSPLNGVGVVVDLPDFSSEQVEKLASQYQLTWNTDQINQLIELVSGHPYLVQLTFSHIESKGITLDQVFAEAATEAGLYGDHLRKKLRNLEQDPDLTRAFCKVLYVEENKPVELKPMVAKYLQRLGLVKLRGNFTVLRCQLYGDYFRHRLSCDH
ncbi:MAG: hypothetical protein F6K36_14495 [Symploca sp. SIO3C6]|nr:hypothetical protein [Symploca sp. SIO3C6]